MQELKPPKVTAVEVVAAQPTEADTAAIANLSAEQDQALPQVAYIVKVRLKTIPPATSQGWALYVGDLRIPKYWEYEHGIYFKVFDPQFFADHKGKRLRFSQNGVDFYDTGIKLPAPTPPAAASRSKRKGTKSKGAKTKAARLPSQDDVLK
jgi:hypothetical protein